jgi:hypothetical protein
MSAIYGLYPTPDAAQRAVNNLRAAGIDQAQITIISSEPFEEHEFAHRDQATAMGWIALGGLGRRVECVDRAHGRTSPIACSACCTAGSTTWCAPTLSSQIEMIGTNFENSV